MNIGKYVKINTHTHIYCVCVCVCQYMLKIVLCGGAWISQCAILKFNFPEGLLEKLFSKLRKFITDCMRYFHIQTLLQSLSNLRLTVQHFMRLLKWERS